ncbi:hypothetical protein PVAP13_9KG049314 [Panicum virgatum]|uniref:Uncharacterized protein n=1 Tax=Panicum virgatum TaxID=38727 RepID=A0A8T0NDD2_PANVG|nr:hypothetical protein PVAP13_9KG049314 [Panicum virgatum]
MRNCRSRCARESSGAANARSSAPRHVRQQLSTDRSHLSVFRYSVTKCVVNPDLSS